MSVDRYLSLRFPLTYRVKRTATRAKVALVLIWLGTTIMGTLLIWLAQHFTAQEPDPEPCSIYYLTSIPLTFVYVALAYWTPIFGTAFIYFLVFSIAKKASKTNSMLKNSIGTVEPPADSQSTPKIVLAKDINIKMTGLSTVSTVAASTTTSNMRQNVGITERNSKKSTKVKQRKTSI